MRNEHTSHSIRQTAYTTPDSPETGASNSSGLVPENGKKGGGLSPELKDLGVFQASWYTQGTGWRHNDLTHTTNATRAIGMPTGYTWDVDDTQHIVYHGEDGQLYELWFTRGPGWQLGSGVTNTAPVRAVGDPVGYT